MTRPETVEALVRVLATHEGAFCICGELTTDPDIHLATALLDAIDAGQVPGLVTSEAVAEAWDECATEAFERGLLHDAFAEEMVARNPYRHGDGGQ